MRDDLAKKSSIEEIRQRFDHDVERFSSLDTAQVSVVDAPLMMELMTQAAATANPDARRILDLGCGAGNNTLKLLQLINPAECHLVDLSAAMLERASQRVSAVHSGAVRTFQCDLRGAPLEDGSYDIILAAAVLHHLRDDRDWRETFQRLYEITAPGGSIWISDLVSHETAPVQDLMWRQYGDYLEAKGGAEYRDKVFAYIEKEDSPRPVTYQMDLLRRVGFSQVELLHKNACFAAFGARKA